MRRVTGLRLVVLGAVGAAVGLGIVFDPDRGARPERAAGPPRAVAPSDALARGVSSSGVGPERPFSLSPLGSQALAEPPPPKPVDTAPAESAIADFRRRTLNPEPQREPASRIAVSGSRVGRIGSDALVVLEPGTRNKSISVNLPGAFAVTGALGALFAVGKDRLVVLDIGAQKPRVMPRPSLFPDSRLMPDLVDATRIWVHHPRSHSLFGYGLEPSTSTLLPLVDTVALSGSDDSCFVGLADGSFLHFTEAGWEQLFVQGKRFDFPWPSNRARPFRALRAHRLDQVYVLGTDAELELYQLGPKLQRLWHRNVGPLPVDAVTSGDTVFLLRAERSQPEELTWKLQVVRRNRPDAVIPLGISDAEVFEGDTQARLLAQFGLAASARWVAVGAAGQLRVWNAKTLEPVDVGK